ncbi:MAG: type-F conjugative transfer system pilin assembly protein TrbC [Alphaproteobacteria bacterium]|nr:type-F conjugative transfer system pilin assembly protein TrbC [Alphaproteobacteria bacterium]
MGFRKGISLSRRRFWLSDLEEKKLLCYVIFILLFLFKIPLCMAENHKSWALEQQEKSQALIRQYEKEALDLKNQAPSTFEGKGCSVHSNVKCCKRQDSKHSPETSHSLSDSTVYIFVSFSMPKETLKTLALEAKKHNVVLVIRGLIENSFLKTATFLKELGESVILDPLLFREYNVAVVPTFIEKSQGGHSKISGNITLAYALSKFKEGGQE